MFAPFFFLLTCEKKKKDKKDLKVYPSVPSAMTDDEIVKEFKMGPAGVSTVFVKAEESILPKQVW